MTVTDKAIRTCLLQLVHDRGPDKTICPSEVARSLGKDNWRDLMTQVRSVGTALAQTGEIVVTQKGAVVDPEQAKGPIRYRLKVVSPETQSVRPGRGPRYR